MGSSRAITELRELAERRHRNPAVSLQRATEIMQITDDPAVHAAAARVIGLALHELGRAQDAVASYRLSIATCVQHGFPDGEALARASLAHSLLTVGDSTGAEREMTQARAVSPEPTRGVVEMLYSVLLNRTGRLDAALASTQRALRWLRQMGDLPAMALLYLNRGNIYAYRGDLAAALDDFGQGERISAERDLPVLVAIASANSGFAYGRLGNVPEALAAFGRAERAYAELGNPTRHVAVLQADRCEVLLFAGLAVEARVAAQAAVEALTPTGDLAYQTECRLLLARALLAERSYRSASAEASRAARQFTAAHRLAWAARARYVAIQAEVLAVEDDGVPSPNLLRRARRIATELEGQGWPVEAAHVRTFVGRLALYLGQPAVARAELARAMAARARGPADLRAQAWHATALLRLADGDRAGAKRALARGMTVVDQYRATLGATELRARAAAHGADLARLGTRLALDEGKAVQVLRWAERFRAGALRRPAVRPPDDEQLAIDLTELRRVRDQIRQGALDRPPALQTARGTSDGAAVADLTARAVALEHAVRVGSRQASDTTAATGRVDLAAVRRALGDRVMVEYVADRGQLYAVRISRTGFRLHHLGPAAAIAQEKNYLLFTLRRLLWSRDPTKAQEALSASATRLDQQLVASLGLARVPAVVVVPTGVLHGIPWSILPSLAGRPTTIAPSAAMWLNQYPPAPPAAGRVALVAGPTLPGAEREVAELAGLYPGADVVVGAEATAPRVLAALASADLGHLAAHGSFRADSPLFSSVLMADGPLTVYDLERLRRVPRTVVLASCHAAVAQVYDGDELLGAAAALLGLGVRWVIAPVMAVPDGATTVFMIALHRRLRAGDPPGSALARAAEGMDRVAAAAFVCIGCDDAGGRSDSD